MTSVTYAIVEFTDEKLVEIVPELWIESFNGVSTDSLYFVNSYDDQEPQPSIIQYIFIIVF